jgi:hypothetical protein
MQRAITRAGWPFRRDISQDRPAATPSSSGDDELAAHDVHPLDAEQLDASEVETRYQGIAF